MRKKFVFFYALILTTLLLLTLFLANKMDKKKENGTNTKVENLNIYNEKNNVGSIKLGSKKVNALKDKVKIKISSTGEIKTLTISEYIKGVLPAEMPPEYDIEALKAQAVIARTYLYKKSSGGAHKDADICDNYAHCQAWYSLDNLFNIWKRSKGYTEDECKKYFAKVEEAVDSTENIVVTYKNKYINAYFHACSGGKTEDVSAIWGRQKIAYLKSVESPGEEQYKNYTSKVKLTIDELETKLNKDSEQKCRIDKEDENVVKILSYSNSGRVDKVEIGGEIYKAETLRTKLGLRSTNFTVEIKDGKVIFNVKGNGHGVGMSQVGANYYASQGYSYIDIITHYYTGVDVVKLYVEGETNEDKI